MNKRSVLDMLYRRKIALEQNVAKLEGEKNYPAEHFERLIQLHKAEVNHNNDEIFFLGKIIDEVIG